jgi:hypothetical protein
MFVQSIPLMLSSSSAEGGDTPKDIPAPVAEPDHVIKNIAFHRLTSTLGALIITVTQTPFFSALG